MAAPWRMHWRADAISAEWINSDHRLAEYCSAWSSLVAFDSEFMRSKTFYPAAGLYQVNCGDEIVLIDPLAIEDFQPLRRGLLDPGITVVMHSASEDLELLHHEFDVHPTPLFDTQVAHAFTSDRFSISYAGLVELYLNIALDKGETRSNWLQRPLTDSQQHYAALDVDYLLPLHEILSEKLEMLGRMPWFVEDMNSVRFREQDPDLMFLSAKKVNRLPPEVLARLRILYSWREVRARAENLPRTHVLWEEHLMTLAWIEQLSEADLQEHLPRSVVRRYGEDLLAELDARSGEPVGEIPQPLSSGDNALVRELRAIATQRAQELDLAPELLARKRAVEECVRTFKQSGQPSDAYAGWRREVLGQAFYSALGG
ncbi:MAG: ribonuclease D [Pseudomonadaceae bacterium]|nr:ribonuclease D [Pseudomonadaceae bacterium]